MKKWLSFVMSITLAVGLLAGCASTATPSAAPAESSTETTAPAATSSVDSITLYQNKVEIDEQLKAFAAEYSNTAGVTVNIETVGGGADFGGSLKAKFASGAAPDIFVIDGPSGYELWKDSIADLSDQAWVSDTDFGFKNPEGKVVGFPVAIEGYGMAYNKDILAKAGVDPATLTTIDGYKAAFEKIDSQKEDLGLDSVVSMAASTGTGMTWVTGLHNFNVYLAAGLPIGDTSIVDKMNNGEVDADRLAQYADYVALLFQYSNKDILLNGNYDAQAQAFAMGKTAFIHQGNWLDPTLVTLGATFDMAYAPHAPFSTPTDGVLAAPPSWYCVNSQSAGAEEAKKFLTAIATTEAGHKYMVEEAGMIPAFKSVQLKPTLPLSKSIMEWAAAGKTYDWHFGKMPDGFGMNTLGPIYEQLAAGNIDTKTFAEMVTSEINALK